MPLSDLQGEILRLLAGHRNPDSYVAGSTPLHRAGPRFSGDIGIFHGSADKVEAAALTDAALLVDHGFGIAWLRRGPSMYSAVVQRAGESTKLEWVADSDYRFFPLMPDDLFGWRLHVADIATNKALAAGGRREPRDVLDLLYIHDTFLPLGAVVWAAVAKDPGFSPESLIAEIRRGARYRADEYVDLAMTTHVDAGAVSRRLRSLLEEADAFVREMPSGKEGLLFLEGGRPVQPDPVHLDKYVEHPGAWRGHWPSSGDIAAAMLEDHGKGPS